VTVSRSEQVGPRAPPLRNDVCAVLDLHRTEKVLRIADWDLFTAWIDYKF